MKSFPPHFLLFEVFCETRESCLIMSSVEDHVLPDIFETTMMLDMKEGSAKRCFSYMKQLPDLVGDRCILLLVFSMEIRLDISTECEYDSGTLFSRDSLKSFIGMAENERNSWFYDSSFFSRDRLECLTEILHMIK